MNVNIMAHIVPIANNLNLLILSLNFPARGIIISADKPVIH